MHWLAHLLGIDNEAGRFYAFWSGAGGDLSVLGAAGVFVRQRNCHVRRCWRLGRHPVDGSTWTVCRRHHPEDHPSATDVKAAGS